MIFIIIKDFFYNKAVYYNKNNINQKIGIG